MIRNKIILLGMLLLVLVSTTGCMTVLDDGETGVKKVWGKYQEEELTTGFKLYNPISTTIYKINTKTINIEETVDVPSNEGLIVKTDVSVIYHLIPENVAEMKKEVTGDIVKTLIVPNIRNGLRDVASGYEAKEMYSEKGRSEIADKLKEQLQLKVEKYVVIEDVLLRDIVLPARVTEAIEVKIDAEQKAQAKEFELMSAKKDAEIEIERAKGIAEANRIISGSITKEYIQYKFIEGLNDGNTEVIYVPTEANIPIMEATRSK